MTNEFDKNLEISLGLRSQEFKNFKVLRVDNGDNKVGLNKTSEFIEKKKNEQGEFERVKFGKKLTGVVLLVRAQVSSKYRKNVDGWISNEFNSSNRDEVIRLYKQKNAFWTGTYRSLKEAFSNNEGDGTTTNNYTYRTILYIAPTDGGEVFKLVLSGKSQKQWFDYSNAVSREFSLLAYETVIEITEDKENDTVYASFSQGNKVDYTAYLGQAKGILPTPANRTLPEPKKEELPFDDSNEVEDIDPDSIPF